MVNTFNSLISVIFDKSKDVGLKLAIVMIMQCSVSVTAAQIDTSVDRNLITLNESFQLIFTATESPDDEPNFSPLKQDFDIINQQKNSESSWVNGATKTTIQWTLTVLAKREGELKIPAISFGNDTSKILSITVIETTSLAAMSNEDELYVEVEVNQQQVYVQAQVLYTLRLYQRINIAQATLTEPEHDNAIIEKLDDGGQYNLKVKGVNYLVTEHKYAVFPQQSGPMTIAPLVLTADIVTQQPRSRLDSFFNQQTTQTRRVLSKAITLNVQPAPADFQASYWLPAKKLQLNESWSNEELKVNVGEPITRTMTIIAEGATSSQLPDLANMEIDSQLKTYPDKPVLYDQKNATGLLGMREQKIAIIPQTAGSFEIPAVEIPWFNTLTKKMEIAVIPAVKLVAMSPPEANTPNNSAITPALVTDSETLPENPPTTIKDQLWKWATFGLGLAWAITLILLYRARTVKQHLKVKSRVNNREIKLNKVTQTLKKACTDNDPQQAQKALIKWSEAKYQWMSLTALSQHCNAELQVELKKLNHALYSKEKLAWNGAALWQAISTQQRQKATSKTANGLLEPLHPLPR